LIVGSPFGTPERSYIGMDGKDLRKQMFRGLKWYEELAPPADAGEPPTVWYLVKGPLESGPVKVVNTALKYISEKGLFEHYHNERFKGLRPKELTFETTRSKRKKVVSPLMDILNEPLTALFLDNVLGWDFRAYRPGGKGRHEGEWLFEYGEKQQVFVEVKTISEAPKPQVGTYNYVNRIKKALKSAYYQLPESGYSTLVVLHDLLTPSLSSLPEGVNFVLDALFGKEVTTTPVGSSDPQGQARLTRLNRDKWVQPQKNRNLGAVATLGYLARSSIDFYWYWRVYHNPYCHPEAAIFPRAFGNCRQFVWSPEGHWIGDGSPIPWLRLEGRYG